MTIKKLYLVFLGAPGSGKGTQAQILAKELNIPHVDTGSMLRAAVAEGTKHGKIAEELMAKGQLVPPEIVTEIIRDRISRPDCSNGIVLDGYPRNLDQAERLELILKDLNIELSVVINIDIDESILTDRLVYRRSCDKCGAKYNLKFTPPKNDELCDVCQSPLSKRDDDSAENAQRRFKTYYEQTQPLIEYYSKKGLLKNIDGNKSINEIFKEVLEAANDH